MSEFDAYCATLAMTPTQALAERIERVKNSLKYRPYERVQTLSLEGILLREVPTDLPEGITVLALNNTDIRELDGATLPRSLRCIEAFQTKLHSVRNLHLLPELQELNLAWSIHMDHLEGPLPRSLTGLTVRNSPYLRTLPSLAHTRLQHLAAGGCHTLERIPDLPSTLLTLGLAGCTMRDLPYLPDSLVFLDPGHHHSRPTPAVRTPQEHARYYRAQQRNALLEIRKVRFSRFHEELMAAAWHPKRVESWLLEGDNVLDMMMGC